MFTERKEQLYEFKSHELAILQSQATSEFNLFLEKKCESFLLSSIQILESTIHLIETGQIKGYWPTDKGYFLRRYASNIVRLLSDPKRNEKAVQLLISALEIFEPYKHVKQVNIEIQRACMQLRKVAYDLKNGILLEYSINRLLQCYDIFPQFKIECYDSKYLIALSKKEFDQAIFYAETLIQSDKDNPTYYRHLAKANLAYLEYKLKTASKEQQLEYLDHKVLAEFWRSYDSNKNSYRKITNDNSKKQLIKNRLIKDLMFLFIVRCKKSILLEGKECKQPVTYVLNEARKNLNISDVNEIKRNFLRKLDIIKSTKRLNFDYEYFSDPPCLEFSEQEIKYVVQQEKPENGSRFLQSTSHSAVEFSSNDDDSSNERKLKLTP